MVLHEALHATAFGSDEACPDDDVVKILVDADISASVIFPYRCISTDKRAEVRATSSSAIG